MKEYNSEDLANRIGPESCERIREGALEALTGETAGRANRRFYRDQDGPLPLTPTPSSVFSILTLITKNTSVYNLLKGLNPYYYPALDVRVGFRAGWDVRPRTVVWLEIHTLI